MDIKNGVITEWKLNERQRFTSSSYDQGWASAADDDLAKNRCFICEIELSAVLREQDGAYLCAACYQFGIYSVRADHKWVRFMEQQEQNRRRARKRLYEERQLRTVNEEQPSQGTETQQAVLAKREVEREKARQRKAVSRKRQQTAAEDERKAQAKAKRLAQYEASPTDDGELSTRDVALADTLCV